MTPHTPAAKPTPKSTTTQSQNSGAAMNRVKLTSTLGGPVGDIYGISGNEYSVYAFTKDTGMADVIWIESHKVEFVASYKANAKKALPLTWVLAW